MHTKTQQLLTALITACVLAPSWTGQAAPAVERPDAGRILQEAQNPGRTLPGPGKADVEVRTPAKPPMAEDNGLKVLIKQFRVTGQDVLPESELTALLAPYVNKELSYRGLQEAAEVIATYLRSHDFLVAQAYLPVQPLDNNTAEIAVVLGRYGDIVLKNQSTVRDHVILSRLSGLRPGTYVRSSELERAALLAGDLGGAAAKLVLAPGKSTGLTDVIVEVTNRDQQTQGSLSYNNWGNRFTGANQTTLNWSRSGLSGSGDSLSLHVTATGQGQNSGGTEYELPVGEGGSLHLSYSKVRYELGEDFASLGAFGSADTLHADYTYALRRSRAVNHTLQLGYDYKKLQDVISYNQSDTGKRAHLVSLGLSGDSADSWGGGGVNRYALTWYHGGLGGSGSSLDGTWEKVTGSLLRQQALTERLSLYVALSGQRAVSNLDTSERFNLGGANAVRAYPSGEGSGDEGWLFTGELRWNLPTKSTDSFTQLIGFYDVGGSHIEKHPADASQNRRKIAGAGLGVNYLVPGRYAVKTYYAWKAGTDPARSDNDKTGRFWVEVSRFF